MGAKENSNDVDKDVKQERRESDYEPVRDSLYSPSNENKNKRNTRVSEKITRKESMENFIRGTKNSNNRQDSSKLQFKTPNNSQKKLQKRNRASLAPKTVNNKKAENVKTPSNPPSEISEESDDKISEEVKEIDTLDDAGTDVETVDIDTEDNSVDDDIANQSANQKIVDMEHRIEQLEEELREVAALEISLYSMVPEHGSSAHKVHTPARRLSRLYIHACKHWSHCKRATVAKNIVSGIVLIAKSCGNDVSRLTFWLSNTVVLREVISQTFGNLFHHDSVDRSDKLNGSANKSESRYPSAKLKNISDGKRPNVIPQMDDWQETSTFAAALENIESWIFSRAVESVWWQTLTPHMQSPKKNLHTEKGMGKTLGPALGDIHQCNLSINLWNTAFHDAFTRLCPVRSSGHECGCLPVLARMVMEECVSRLDVAMFNAILRESATEMPTDPISDPIVDSKVLPIPAGDLSFGSGAQLKNSIGNWSRCLSDFFGLDSEDCTKDVEETNEHYDTKRANTGSKSFALLNELSDLLMLPKDMLIDKDIRKEICPSINLSLITRILCNFTPDEFCPDHVPGIVLEDLNAESLLELSQSEKDRNNIFPYLATPVLYKPPSPSDVANKVADVNGKIVLGRNASILRRKGYTSDDDLDDLDSPLKSIVNKTINRENSSKENDIFKEKVHTNARFKLLREVWTE